MTRLLKHLFSVRPGEWPLVLLLQGQLFLIIAVLLVVKPVAGAWFIDAFGADALAFVFIATALLAGIVSHLYDRARRRYSALRLNLGGLGGSFLILILLLLLRQFPGTEPVVAAGLYLWMAIYGLLAASQFWMLANFTLDIRQAKRLFGFIGAGGILGGIAGGYLTSIFARSLGADLLLLGAGLLLIPTMAISVYIWKAYVERIKRPKSKTNVTPSEHAKSAWQNIAQSRHLQLICGLIVLGVMVSKLVDYQFSALAADRFSDPDRLAAFFGFWFSSFNVIALLLQLLVTRWILRWFSVSGTLLFLPFGIGFGALLMVVMPGLSAAVVSRGADGSFKQSLNRAAFELLYLPLSADLKQQVKTYIDVFVDSLAGGLGGLTLLLLIDAFGLEATQISWAVLLLVVGWVACVILVREEYMDAFRERLTDLKPRKRSPYLRSYHKQLLNSFLRVLRNPKQAEQEEEVFFILEKAENFRDQRFQEPIAELLEHPSPAVRLRALRALFRYRGEELDKLIKLRLADDDAEVRIAAYECLLSQELIRETHGRTDSDLRKLLKIRLDHESAEVAGPALVALVTETAGNLQLRRNWRVKQRLQRRLQQLSQLPESEREAWKLYLVQAAGRSNLPVARDLIRRGLSAKSPGVVQQAILAAGEHLQNEWISKLIHLATIPEYEDAALAALQQYQGKIHRELPARLHPMQFSRPEMLVIPRVLARMEQMESVQLLLDLMLFYQPHDLKLRKSCLEALGLLHHSATRLKVERETAYRLCMAEVKTLSAQIDALQTLGLLGKALPERQELDCYSELFQLLEIRMLATLERLFLGLSLLWKPSDMHASHRGLLDEDRAQRLRAIEYLDNLFDKVFKKQLLPALEKFHRRQEWTDLATKPEDLDNLLTKERQQLRRILRSPDKRLKKLVFNYVAVVGDESYGPLLRPQLLSDHADIRDRAFEVMAGLE